MTAVSSETGETLWTWRPPSHGRFCPEDVVVIDGVVWAASAVDGKKLA